MVERNGRATCGRAVALMLGAVLAGCGALSDDDITVETVDGWTAVGRSAEVQVTILRTDDNAALFCMAPEPDAVSTFQEGLAVAVTGGATRERLGEEARRGALGLGGRNPHVLLARDVFYRACEVVINHRLGPAEAMALYREALATVAPAFTIGAPGSVPLADSGGILGLRSASARRGWADDDDDDQTDDDGADDDDADGDDGAGDDDGEAVDVAETSPG